MVDAIDVITKRVESKISPLKGLGEYLGVFTGITEINAGITQTLPV